MEPGEIVNFGRFVTRVGPRIAEERCKNSATISVKNDDQEIFGEVVECPDFDDALRKYLSRKSHDHFALAYSIQADLATCKISCYCWSATFTAVKILQLLRLTDSSQADTPGDTSATTTYSLRDFFDIVRARIAQKTDSQLPLDVLHCVREGEKVLRTGEKTL